MSLKILPPGAAPLNDSNTSECAFVHTKTPLAAKFLDKVRALDDLKQNLDNNIVGSPRLISHRSRVVRRLAALVHFLYQLLYECVSVCLQFDNLMCKIRLWLECHHTLIWCTYFICH